MTRWTEGDVPDQTGRVVVITGANSGVGFETARVLAARGATAVLACRSEERAGEAIARISAETPTARLEVVPMDLADQVSVRRAADAIRDRHDRIDLLVNNAGVLMTPFALTADGFELQLATNHLGHFTLTGLLLDRMLDVPSARVVTVTSVGHRIGRIDFDDLGCAHGYSRAGAYARSKLANQLFAHELQRRLSAAGAAAVSMSAHPGSASTDIARSIPAVQRALSPLQHVLQQSAAMGALPVLRAAVDPTADGGECFGPRGLFQWRGYPKRVTTSRRSRDAATQRRLWDVSEDLTRTRFPV